jgi:hypothetical protein
MPALVSQMRVSGHDAVRSPDGATTKLIAEHSGPSASYWKVIMSVRLSVGDFGFNGSFDRLALP